MLSVAIVFFKIKNIIVQCRMITFTGCTKEESIMSGQTINPVLTDITAHVASHSEYSSHEKIFLITDEASGLDARIFIHSLIDGRALGGCRRWEYRDEREWNADGLRLARGMTRKSAVAGLPLGGAKAAIRHGNPTALMMRAFGRGIDMIERKYGMAYITAADVGITEELLKEVKKETGNVRGIAPKENGIPLSGGDPGPFTAYGVFAGIKAAVKHKLGKSDLKGVAVAVQGLGDVGYYLCRFLHDAGTKLFVADLDQSRIDLVVSEYGAVAVAPGEIVAMSAEVFAPCAMGGVLSEKIGASIVAGSANNQQKDEINNRESRMLLERGILYAPDYVINAGGLISVYHEGKPRDRILDQIGRQVSVTLERIFAVSDLEDIDTATIADRMAEKPLQFSVNGRRVAA
jgi:leucine dehydrogenase